MQELSDLVRELPTINLDVVIHFLEKIVKPDYCEESLNYILEDNRNVASFLAYHIQDHPGVGLELNPAVSVYRMMKVKGDLPRVSEETLRSVIKEYNQSNKEKYIFKVFGTVYNKDPALFEFLLLFSIRTDKPLRFLTTSLLVYRLLEKQAELNKLKIN
ncbi:hypothetical protein JW756_05015 [Candidatus Woesearchaeota archaeon]|nr:hypothetical protein [Candidatus Woesearchaeota archaeon]